MDYDDLRSIVHGSGVDVFTLIDTAIAVASADDPAELRRRRDAIVERLYAATCAPPPRCANCDVNGLPDAATRPIKGVSPATPQSVDNRDDDEEEEEEEGVDPYAGLFDDEPKKILDIKKQLEDRDQSEDSLIELLQGLVDMEISFQELKDADIGRHVSQLRKQHQSEVVRRLAKQLVRKWKGIVDEWVKLHGEESTNSVMVDGDSPQQKVHQNGHQQVPDFGYSPNPHNGSSGSDKNSEPERKPKVIPRKETPPKPTQAVSAASATQNRQREQRERNLDADDKLASARKRLQANYKEAENAKKQRTIQVMDIHDIPKPKNSFIARNKGGGGSGSHQGRHW